MKIIVFMMTLILFPFCAQAYEDDLDGLLNDYVTPVSANGIRYNGVDYDGWSKDVRHENVRDTILAVEPDSLLSKHERLAYWINAYNVLTIDLIVRERERQSIKNLGRFLRSPWTVHKWTISGRDYTLDNIEHDIIRPKGDARIHFAVNCAAKSCPDLRGEAYRANTLDLQLDEQTRLTFQNTTKGFRKEGDDIVRVTKVMDWFSEDFDNGDLNNWLAGYSPNVVNADTKIRFFDYDWSLNKQQ